MNALDAVVRFGMPMETTFLSVQGRQRGERFFTAGLLPRDAAGEPNPGGLDEQLDSIRSQLRRVLAESALTDEALRLLDVHVPVDALIDLNPVVLHERLSGSGCPVLRLVAVAGLNNPNYLLEVAAIATNTRQDPAFQPSASAHVLAGPTCAWAGDLCFFAGHFDRLGVGADLADRYETALRALLDSLAAVGLGPRDLVQTTTYLAGDVGDDDLSRLGERRRSLLDHELPPAGTTVRVTELASRDSAVQIAGVGAVAP